jgi:hypothetical protein
VGDENFIRPGNVGLTTDDKYPPRALVMLAIDISETIQCPVSRCSSRSSIPSVLAAIDFFTVPTATFRVLFCFIVLEHSRRRILHFNVTANPTVEWTRIQILIRFNEPGRIP